MTQPFARGALSFGFCDRCGQRYPLGELQYEVVKLKKTGLKVCPTCFDPDHPQLQLGMYPVIDPQALREPRVDVNRNESNAMVYVVGSSPSPTIGATVGTPVGVSIGNVTVIIS